MDHKDFHIRADFDQAAVLNSALAYISLVGYTADIKAMRAALASNLNRPMRLRGLTFMRWAQEKTIDDVWPMIGCKYRLETHKLGFGQVHALFICRKQGLLFDSDDETLWADLKQERFTTPLLKSWLPYVKQELFSEGWLCPLYTVDCHFHQLSATSKELDQIVETGLQKGFLKIQPEGLAI